MMALLIWKDSKLPCGVWSVLGRVPNMCSNNKHRMQELEGGSEIYHAPCRSNHYSHKNNPLVATSLLESSLKKQRFQLLNCFHPVPFKGLPSLCWDTINWRFHQIFWIANDSAWPPPTAPPSTAPRQPGSRSSPFLRAAWTTSQREAGSHPKRKQKSKKKK